MSLKLSRYNHFAKDDSEDYLFCNILRGLSSLRRVKKDDNETLDVLLRGEGFGQSSKLNELRRAGFLINEEEDELHKVRTFHEDVIRSNVLGLILMPTGACNFRCKYCYEDFEKGRMTKEVQISILKYVQNQLNYFSRLSVDWFGGEPLEALDIVEYLMTNIKQICSKRGAYYRSGMTTNGYSLTPEVFEKLYKLQIFAYQITLDGNKEQHDTQRILENGAGTYERIFENLLYIRENPKFTKVSVMIRVNLTRSIVENLSEFLTTYKKNFSDDKRFSLLFHKASDFGDNIPSDFSENIERANVFEILNSRNILESADFDLSGFLGMISPFSSICYAAQKNSFVIGSEADIYKCTVYFNEDVNKLGKLTKNGVMDIDPYKHTLWYGKKTLPNTCIECNYLPACYGGGCPYNVNFRNSDICYSLVAKQNINKIIKYISRFVDAEVL